MKLPMPARFPRVVCAHDKRTRPAGPAAAPGEWAVAGSFRYAHRDPATLLGREAPAFRASWLGLDSFAPALHCEAAPITPDELERVARRLAAHLLGDWNADSPEQAAEIVREEIGFALALADHPAGTILALRRGFGDQGLMEQAIVLAGPPDGR